MGDLDSVGRRVLAALIRIPYLILPPLSLHKLGGNNKRNDEGAEKNGPSPSGAEKKVQSETLPMLQM